MRIVNREEFIKLPKGTLYSEYEPVYFRGLFIKGDSLGDIDYIELDIMDSVKSGVSCVESFIIDKEESGESFEMDYELYGRNGLYQDGQKYLIYDKNDIEKLINLLISIK